MEIIPGILFIWYMFVLFIGSLGVAGVWRRMERPRKVDPAKLKRVQGMFPAVTIVRPLKGLDNALYECLKSSFVQTYPVELIFCVAEETDPAINVVKKLISEHPHVDASILIGNENYGPNPKVNNLAKGYMAAKNDLLWCLDSNVWAAPNSVEEAVIRFYDDPSVQLVHNIPTALASQGGYGSQLDEMYLLTSHAKFYTGINKVGIAPCVCGKSNFYRRSALDAATDANAGEGIRVFAKYISEDQMIAEALWSNGGRTAMLDHPVIQPLGNSKLKIYWDRRTRWIRVRKYMVIAATLVEPTTESIPAGLIGAYGGGRLFFGHFSWYWFFIHMFLWVCIDYFQFYTILSFRNLPTSELGYKTGTTQSFLATYPNRTRTRTLIDWFCIWLSREILSGPIWFVAVIGSKIEWRDRPFRIRSDLTAEEIVSGQ